ncbi:hypothetical protein CDAR_381941 [Caerostris darwini]|uniref:Uncharacterized protein n=1 Tax=Caerostris darwini TaxID=1538125 RepID=A0AAV4V5F0_9ARAC|nr:hypothetical protein CDAR_381941 [Caerostris darwini]
MKIHHLFQCSIFYNLLRKEIQYFSSVQLNCFATDLLRLFKLCISKIEIFNCVQISIDLPAHEIIQGFHPSPIIYFNPSEASARSSNPQNYNESIQSLPRLKRIHFNSISIAGPSSTVVARDRPLMTTRNFGRGHSRPLVFVS